MSARHIFVVVALCLPMLAKPPITNLAQVNDNIIVLVCDEKIRQKIRQS